MKHIQIFEAFINDGEETDSPKNYEVVISVEGQNPDAKWGFQSVGIGTTPEEAAYYSLSAAHAFNINWDENLVIDSQRKAYDITDTTEDDFGIDLNEIIPLLAKGEIPRDHFDDHGTSSECSATVDRTDDNVVRGYIQESWIEDSEDSEDEDE